MRMTRHIAIAMILFNGAALACDCAEYQTLEDRFERAHTVLVVSPQMITVSATRPGYVTGIADLVSILKGSGLAVVPILGFTPTVDCWAPIDVGRNYLVFLPEKPDRQRVAFFSMCMSSVPMTDVPQEILRHWRESR